MGCKAQWNLKISVCCSPKGMFPPDAVLRHRTSGNGSPPTRHWKITELPLTTVWFCGPRMRNGFTVIVSLIKLNDSTQKCSRSYHEPSNKPRPIRERRQRSLRCTGIFHRPIAERLVSPSYRRQQCEFCKRERETAQKRIEFVILFIRSYVLENTNSEDSLLPESSYLNCIHYCYIKICTTKELFSTFWNLLCPLFARSSSKTQSALAILSAVRIPVSISKRLEQVATYNFVTFRELTSIAVSPWATRVFCGSSRKPSRRTEEAKREVELTRKSFKQFAWAGTSYHIMNNNWKHNKAKLCL